MNFLFITTNLSGGGAEKAILSIANILNHHGHNAGILILENQIEHKLPDDLTVQTLSTNNKRTSHSWIGKHLSARRLRKHINRSQIKYDLIVSTLPYADEIVHLAQLPRHCCRIANTLSAEIISLEHSNPSKAKRRKRRYQSLYGDTFLVAVSEGVNKDLSTTLKLPTKPQTIPNPVNISSIRELSINPDNLPAHPYIIHVGRFSPQKRHDLLLDAWLLKPELPNLVLLTTPNPELSNMITSRNLQDRVLIAGFQTNPYPWIAKAELLVLCSDHEGLPNVLLEALACETAVVSTNCPSGPAEILRDMPECLVPCGDVYTLADTIVHNLETPPVLDRMDFSPYLPEKIAHAWETVAQQALT